ncbi:hypothetical protein OUZ56_005498 [Daphnia magna]|uniref:Uncharacterized protein n=1 Tax=Daphnia magna TaxID=35525 RepID=A0ABQ9YSX9_9CRUS|nr:hypothetical protein OUZ56_005498 [Daphnia magna]
MMVLHPSRKFVHIFEVRVHLSPDVAGQLHASAERWTVLECGPFASAQSFLGTFSGILVAAEEVFVLSRTCGSQAAR